MATGAFKMYSNASVKAWDRTLNLTKTTAGDYKLALFTTTYTPNQASNTLYSGLSGELAAAGGYSTGGLSLTGSGVSAQSTGVKWVTSSPTFTATADITGIKWGVIYDVATSILIGYFDFDDTSGSTTVGVTDTNTFTVTAPATGWVIGTPA